MIAQHKFVYNVVLLPVIRDIEFYQIYTVEHSITALVRIHHLTASKAKFLHVGISSV